MARAPLSLHGAQNKLMWPFSECTADSWPSLAVQPLHGRPPRPTRGAQQLQRRQLQRRCKSE